MVKYLYRGCYFFIYNVNSCFFFIFFYFIFFRSGSKCLNGTLGKLQKKMWIVGMIVITKDYTEYKFIGDTNDEEMYHIIFPVFHVQFCIPTESWHFYDLFISWWLMYYYHANIFVIDYLYTLFLFTKIILHDCLCNKMYH